MSSFVDGLSSHVRSPRLAHAQVEFTNVLVDGCLFEKCYASKKGGGLHQGIGQMTVVDSLFYNNTAGSGNKEAGELVRTGLLKHCMYLMRAVFRALHVWFAIPFLCGFIVWVPFLCSLPYPFGVWFHRVCTFRGYRGVRTKPQGVLLNLAYSSSSLNRQYTTGLRDGIPCCVIPCMPCHAAFAPQTSPSGRAPGFPSPRAGVHSTGWRPAGPTTRYSWTTTWAGRWVRRNERNGRVSAVTTVVVDPRFR